MKRSPLARGDSQLRRTPLARGLSQLARSGPVRAVSRSRARENRERTEMLREARIYPQICAVPWCTQVGDSPHEPLTRARGGSITDPDNVVMICWPHNVELASEPGEWAYELGLLRHSWDNRE